MSEEAAIMATLSVGEASQAHARVPRRRAAVHSAWYVVATLLVAFGSAAGATTATRWLLRGVPVRAPAAKHTLPPPLPVAHDGVTLGGGSPYAVGIGATQSFNSLAITVDQLRIAASHDFVGAPAGSQVAIVTVTLANTDPIRTLPYNAAEFWLIDPSGAARHEVFAALAQPLGAGQVAPHAQIVGEVAFWVTATPDALAPDPQIVFAPAAAPDFALRWDVPLTSPLP